MMATAAAAATAMTAANFTAPRVMPDISSSLFGGRSLRPIEQRLRAGAKS
jgi:hypothetical protein